MLVTIVGILKLWTFLIGHVLSFRASVSGAEVVVGRPCEEPSPFAPQDAIAEGHPHDAKMQV